VGDARTGSTIDSTNALRAGDAGPLFFRARARSGLLALRSRFSRKSTKLPNMWRGFRHHADLRSAATVRPLQFGRYSSLSIISISYVWPFTNRAIKNATLAAAPPITTVCNALRTQARPVSLPFMAPNTNNATSVNAAEK
jgi:hypothetical protein